MRFIALALLLVATPAAARPQCDSVKPSYLTQESLTAKALALQMMQAKREARYQDVKSIAYTLEPMLLSNPVTTVWSFCEADVDPDGFLKTVKRFRELDARPARQVVPSAPAPRHFTCQTQDGGFTVCDAN